VFGEKKGGLAQILGIHLSEQSASKSSRVSKKCGRGKTIVKGKKKQQEEEKEDILKRKRQKFNNSTPRKKGEGYRPMTERPNFAVRKMIKGKTRPRSRKVGFSRLGEKRKNSILRETGWGKKTDSSRQGELRKESFAKDAGVEEGGDRS